MNLTNVYSWSDPFLHSEQLSADERMILDAAQPNSQGKLQPRIIEADTNEVKRQINTVAK